MSRFSIAVSLLLAILTNSAMGAECPKRPVLETRPTFAGSAEDPENGIGITWRSVAGMNAVSGAWEIDNSVCNAGSARLTIVWEKAGISNRMKLPLSPGRELYNHLQIGGNPPSESQGPLSYGGPVSTTTNTQVYELPTTGAKLQATLDSVIGMNVVERSGVAPVADEFDSLWVRISVTNKGEGYTLATWVASGQARNLRLALRSSQAELIAQALRSMRVEPVTVADLQKLTGERGLGVAAFPYVVFPASLNTNIFIRTSVSGVEVADLVVLDGVTQLMLGKVALYR